MRQRSHRARRPQRRARAQPDRVAIPITVEVVASGLVSPIQLVQPPGSDTRRFVVDQIGLIA